MYEKVGQNKHAKFEATKIMSLRDDYYSYTTQIVDSIFDREISVLELSDFLIEPLVHYEED